MIDNHKKFQLSLDTVPTMFILGAHTGVNKLKVMHVSMDAFVQTLNV